MVVFLHAVIVFLHAVIVVIQVLAFSATVKLIRITRQWSWLAIGAGLGLAAVRTVQPMYKYFAGIGQLPSIERTLISLTITVLLFISLYYAIPKFRAMQQQADRSLENERRLRTLMDNLPGIAYRCRNDRNWTMEFISDGCLSLTGYDSSHLLNNTRLSFADLIHKDDKDRVWQEVQSALDEGRKFQLTYRIRTAQGEERWVWEQGCGIYAKGSNKPHALEGFITDITERKRAELEQLESETRFRQITENLRDVFWLTDWAERKVVYVSPAYKEVWGRECQSLYDAPKSWRDVLHHDDRDRVVEAFEQSCPEKPFDIEYRIIRGDGSTRWIHDRAIPIMGNDGSIYRMAGFSEDITARKEAEVRVRDNEMRLRLLVEQMPAIVWTVDEHMRFDSSVGAGLTALGLQPNESRGIAMTEYFQTDDPDVVPLAMHRRGLAGESVTYETEWAGRTYHCFLEPRRATDGKINGVVGVALDISEQKNSAKLLMESELRFRGAFDHAPIGIALVGVNGRFLKVNRRLCEMVGYNESELTQLTFQQITHVDDLRAGMEALTEFMRGQRNVYRVEKRYVHRNGRVVWIDLSVSPVCDVDGRVLYFVSQMQDVTDRKAAERELRESEQRFRSAFDDAPIGEALIDRDNHFLKVNRRLCEMLGYQEQELLNKSFDSVAHPEDVDKCRQLFERFRTGEVSYVEVTKRYLHRDGRIVWAEVTGSGVCDEDGQPIYFVVQIKDITERKQTEDLRQQRDLAESANRAKNAFLANVSHEIRTPLMSILGAGESLLWRKKLVDGGVDYVDMILRNGRHLLALVNDLLDLASIEAGKLDVYPLECSVTELLADVQAVVGPLHTQPRVEFSFDYATPIPTRIRTDPIRLKQAIINLVNNALKYTDAGFVRLSVRAAEKNDERYVSFTVEDSGTGIKADDLERVFQAFSRVGLRSHRLKGGAGLGLPLTEWIARALGGCLEVESEWGRGSLFTLVVPCGEVRDMEWTTVARCVIPPTGLPAVTMPVPMNPTCGSILLAEDDPDVRLLVSDGLMQAGAEVVAVENGQDAVEMAIKRAFDLILLDVRMPILSGLEAVVEMRRCGIVAPIIAMTASTAQTELDRLVRSGFDDLWPKPISMERLVESAMMYLPEGARASEPKSAPMAQVFGPKNSGRMQLVIEEFKKTLPTRLQRIEDAVSAEDPAETCEALHQLVGTSGMMGIPELSSEAARLLRKIRAEGAEVTSSDLVHLRDIVSGATEAPV